MAPITEYPDMEGFYQERGGISSPEADFGVHWERDAGRWPTWRVSYVQETGDVYAVRNAGKRIVLLLGRVEPDSKDLGEAGWYETLDRILDGWPERCGQPGGLAWIEERLGAAGWDKP